MINSAAQFSEEARRNDPRVFERRIKNFIRALAFASRACRTARVPENRGLHDVRAPPAVAVRQMIRLAQFLVQLDVELRGSLVEIGVCLVVIRGSRSRNVRQWYQRGGRSLQ